MQKPIAIVLGGTVPHISLLKKLKERGYYTILIDYLDNPPAKEYANAHIKASTLDQEKVLEIAKDKKASLVISTCIDQANSVCCYVAEKMGLPRPYSYETSLLVTDKGQMKKRMMEYEIPTSSFTLTKSTDDINWDKIIYPCVVKPVDCNSSKGVHRADSQEEVKHYVDGALKLSRTRTAIIESYCEGYEIQVDCVALEDCAHIVMTRQKMMAKRENATVLQSFGSIVPAPFNKKLLDKSQEIADKIMKGFNLHNTPFFYQAIVSGDDIMVLEFAPRIGGGLSYYMLQQFVGYDSVGTTIDSFLGKTIEPSFHPLTQYYRTCLLYSLPCVFDHIENLDTLKEEGIIIEYYVTKSKGEKIDGDLRSTNRVGSFIVSGHNYEEINNKAKISFNRVKIIDDKGMDMMNRKIIEVKQSLVSLNIC